MKRYILMGEGLVGLISRAIILPPGSGYFLCNSRWLFEQSKKLLIFSLEGRQFFCTKMLLLGMTILGI